MKVAEPQAHHAPTKVTAQVRQSAAGAPICPRRDIAPHSRRRRDKAPCLMQGAKEVPNGIGTFLLIEKRRGDMEAILDLRLS
jgi:hypothetical protein